MTVATNALLEGNTARTALIATAGFEDVIELARQNRPHLYRLCQARASAAGGARAAPRRARADRPRGRPGGARRRPRTRARDRARGATRSDRPQAVAVCLLHSYADPVHEQLLGEQIRELLPDAALSLSSELVGTFREYERTATTALDAALSPLLSSYLGRLSLEARAEGLPEPQIMQSSGGLTDSGRAGSHAALTVLSGPAGGVGGASLLAELAGEREVLCLDMGGTSCDVCRDRRRGGRRDGRTADRRAPAGAAGARHPHRRRRRRLDRLARRGRGAAGRAGLGRVASRAPPATGSAASARRSPTRTCCSGACSRTRRWRAACSWTARPPSAAVAGLARELDLGLLELRRGRSCGWRRRRCSGPCGW